MTGGGIGARLGCGRATESGSRTAGADGRVVEATRGAADCSASCCAGVKGGSATCWNDASSM